MRSPLAHPTLLRQGGLSCLKISNTQNLFAALYAAWFARREWCPRQMGFHLNVARATAAGAQGFGQLQNGCVCELHSLSAVHRIISADA